MIQEIEEGNIEYKRKLTMTNIDRFDTLITQMNWRLNEGNGEAIYYLGINDNGSIYQFKNDESNDTILTFKHIANMAKIKIVSIKKIIDRNQHFFKAIIQIQNNFVKEKKIIILGNPRSGKTTFLSFLLYGVKDNGNGYLRNKLLRYDHEFNTGSTEALVVKSIGINDDNIFNYSTYVEFDEIKKFAHTIITFFDVTANYLHNSFNLIKYMDHIIIMQNNDNVDQYILMANKYNLPYTIINNNLPYVPLTIKYYELIDTRKCIGNGIILLNIISYNKNEFLVTCMNINSKLSCTDTIYFANSLTTNMTFGHIISLRYFDKYIDTIDKNVVFTAKILYNNNLKKQKRSFFYVA